MFKGFRSWIYRKDQKKNFHRSIYGSTRKKMIIQVMRFFLWSGVKNFQKKKNHSIIKVIQSLNLFKNNLI